MDDQKEWASLVKEIDQGARLTAWEEDFIDDMLKLMDKNTPFSKKQGETIERIYKQRIG
jgi:hypothetical protein